MQPRLQKGACSALSRLAAQGAGLGWLGGFGIAGGHGEAWRPPASLPRRRSAATRLRASRAELPATAMTAGCATSRFAPGASSAARRSSARASNAARSCASSISEARLRGRTIWTKPKPLTAVRSNGCGRIASIAAAAACRAALPPAVGRSIPIDPPMSSRRIARAASAAPAHASSSAWQEPIDVDQGHRRRRRNAQLAAGECDRSRCAPASMQIVPSRGAKFVPGRGQADVASRQARGRWRQAIASVTPRQRSFPRLGSGNGCARDFDLQRCALGRLRARRAAADIPRRSARGDCVAAVAPDIGQPRVEDVPARRLPSSCNPRLDDLAVVDQRGAGFADSALDQPFRQVG